MIQFQAESAKLKDGSLIVVCSGDFGYGSGGNESARTIYKRINDWSTEHAGVSITHIVLNFVNVDYIWGDGPLSGVVFPLMRKCKIFTFVTNKKNDMPLRNLVEFAAPRIGETITVHLNP